MKRIGLNAEQIQPKAHSFSSQLRVLCVFGVWIVLVGYGFSALIRYDATPGEFGKPAAAWPTNETILFAGDCLNLVVFIHPQCSCTRAMSAELLVILGKIESRYEKHVVFVDYGMKQHHEIVSQYRTLIEYLPSAKIHFDTDGRLIKKFGVRTSGHVLLYNASGELIFSGGVTISRGHEGENSGGQLLEERLRGTSREYAEHPVFGCSLVDPLSGSEVSR